MSLCSLSMADDGRRSSSKMDSSISDMTSNGGLSPSVSSILSCIFYEITRHSINWNELRSRIRNDVLPPNVPPTLPPWLAEIPAINSPTPKCPYQVSWTLLSPFPSAVYVKKATIIRVINAWFMASQGDSARRAVNWHDINSWDMAFEEEVKALRVTRMNSFLCNRMRAGHATCKLSVFVRENSYFLHDASRTNEFL